MYDFTKGKLWKGILLAFVNGLIFIGIPIALKTYDIKFSGISVVVSEDFVNKWLYCGIPITIISFFTGFYEKGNKWKVYATGVQAIVVIAALFYIFGTNVDNIIEIQYQSSMHITIGLAIAGLLVFICISKALKFGIACVDYIDYRKEFREEVRKKERPNKLLKKLEMIDEEQKE